MSTDPSGSAAQPEQATEPDGHAEVAAALARLDTGESLDLDAHAELYDDVHRRLAAVLADGGGPVPHG